MPETDPIQEAKAELHEELLNAVQELFQAQIQAQRLIRDKVIRESKAEPALSLAKEAIWHQYGSNILRQRLLEAIAFNEPLSERLLMRTLTDADLEALQTFIAATGVTPEVVALPTVKATYEIFSEDQLYSSEGVSQVWADLLQKYGDYRSQVPHESEFSELFAQLDASDAESVQRQAVIAELRQASDTDLAALAEVVAAL